MPRFWCEINKVFDLIATLNLLKPLKFLILGKVVPKARPRFDHGNISLPKNYRLWKNTAYLSIINQVDQQSIKDLPIDKASVEVRLVSQLKGNADNILGSYLDLLVMADFVPDDCLSCIP